MVNPPLFEPGFFGPAGLSKLLHGSLGDTMVWPNFEAGAVKTAQAIFNARR